MHLSLGVAFSSPEVRGFMMCSVALNGGVRVNPFNLEHVVEQLDAALSMPADERRARLQKDINFVQEHTTASWLKMAVNDMHRVRSADAASQPAAAAPQRMRALCSWAAGVRAAIGHKWNCGPASSRVGRRGTP